jgi:hypothetical protein
MSHETSVLLERLAHEEDSLVVRSVRSLLETPDVHVDTYFDHLVKAGEVEPIWRVRQLNAKVKRKRFHGIAALVSALQASSPARPIEMAHVRDNVQSATLFFDAGTKAFIGAVIVTMSAHTRAYYRGELKGKPFEAVMPEKKPAVSSRRVVKQKKVMA